MSDRTEPRLREICRRARLYRKSRLRASVARLSAACVCLAIGIGVVISGVHVPGVSRVAGGWSAVLLQRGTGAYVVVGVGAFIVGVAFTVACFRIQEQKLKKNGESKR